MKKVLAAVVAVALMSVFAIQAGAQTPNVQVYFDANASQASTNCPPGPGPNFDQLVVVANNWNMFMTSIEYKIDYGPAFVFLGDIIDPGALSLGSSTTGIGITWPTPQNAFGPHVTQFVSVIWNCDDCSSTNLEVKVSEFPVSGQLRAIRWPDNAIIQGIGMTSLVCATVATEATTWGGIKAQFR